MRRSILAMAAAVAITGAAQATTNAGTVPPAESAFPAASTAGPLMAITDMQFGNGRSMPLSVTRDPGLTSAGFVPNGLTSGGPLAGVPEPTAWMMLIAGFGLVGLVARTRKPAISA